MARGPQEKRTRSLVCRVTPRYMQTLIDKYQWLPAVGKIQLSVSNGIHVNQCMQ